MSISHMIDSKKSWFVWSHCMVCMTWVLIARSLVWHFHTFCRLVQAKWEQRTQKNLLVALFPLCKSQSLPKFLAWYSSHCPMAGWKQMMGPYSPLCTAGEKMLDRMEIWPNSYNNIIIISANRKQYTTQNTINYTTQFHTMGCVVFVT